MIKSSETLVVVEPHADDALLSLGGHIEAWVKEGKRVIIVTLRTKESLKRLEDGAAYAAAVGAEYVGHVEPATSLPTGRAILPLGITHLEHVEARKRWQKPYSWYYLDQPYAAVQRNSARVTELVRNMRIVSYLQPGLRKYRHIPLFKHQAKFFHYNPAEKLCRNVEMIYAN